MSNTCSTCNDTGWVCAGTGKPADFDGTGCCGPHHDTEFGDLGTGCVSANGCPDCDRSESGSQQNCQEER